MKLPAVCCRVLSGVQSKGGRRRVHFTGSDLAGYTVGRSYTVGDSKVISMEIYSLHRGRVGEGDS